MQLVSYCLRFAFKAFVIVLFFVITVSCGKGSPDALSSNGQTDVPFPTNSHAAVWEEVAEASAWTDTALSEIRLHLSEFEAARDKTDFCPNYDRANAHSREVCWLRLVSAVVKYESGFNPSDRFREASGRWSIGLMALSAHECPNAPTNESLKNPHKNLICGIGMMAGLIARDGFIDGPGSARGAAAYWSTLRLPYVSRRRHVGKKRGVMAYTRQYLQY